MSRSWKLALLTVAGLCMLLLVPLSQLNDHSAAGYYYNNHHPGGLSRYPEKDGPVYNNTLYTGTRDSVVKPELNVGRPCDGFPNMDNIMLVMKSGATEAYTKLPTQLLTNLQCLDDFLLFSDLEQQIGKYHVYNVLEDVKDDVKPGLEEFALYDAQQACPISQAECTKDMPGGWELDKYKFLHMIERAWEMRPGREWYVFAEADTYVFWANLVYWLRHKANAKEAPYVGSKAFTADRPFAHGGSGYVIAGQTVKKMIEGTPNLAAKYDAIAPKECCGDLLMSLAVQATGTEVKQAHPMFNGEKPNTLPYGNGHWCEPLLTMHHVNSEEVSSVWQYEQTRATKRDLIQIRDMYEAFFAPHLVPQREDWDNLSDDTCYIGPSRQEQDGASADERSRQKHEEEKSAVERRAHNSTVACAAVCEAWGLDINDEVYGALHDDKERDHFVKAKYNFRVGDDKFHKARECFQWRYRDGVCCIARSFKLGTPRVEKKKEERLTSGWFVDGINDWIDSMGDCPVLWTKPE